jgi:ABC-type bacteriocin/lantibiotic exporter with double-glycine peptidase domain
MNLNFGSSLRDSFNLLGRKDKQKTLLLALLQAGLGFFDLAAVAVIGVLGALAVQGIQSKAPEGTTSEILQLIGLNDWSFQSQVAALGLLAGFLFISKTLLSIFVTRKSLKFLGNRSAELSKQLIAKTFSLPLNKIKKQTSQLTLFSVTTGANTIMLGVIGSTITTLSDFVLMILMIATLAYVDFSLSIVMVLVFGTIGLLLYRYLRAKAQKLGIEGTNHTISSNRNILDAIETYRESFVSNTRGNLVASINAERTYLAQIMVEKAFLPNITKYFFEIILIVGSISVSAYQFLLSDAMRAVGTLTVFIAAGSRIAPAALRIQQWALQLKSNIAASVPTLELARELQEVEPIIESHRKIEFSHPGFDATVSVENVVYKHKENARFEISAEVLNISKGQLVAIVGPSGAGKSTLADLMLGIILPEIGTINISGVTPGLAIQKWPGAISYVPQQVHLVAGTIRENVTRGYNPSDVPEDRIYKAIEIAQLTEFVSSLPDGIDYILDENASNLSGGQRQRLGIARALLSLPELLVMDEATSALDAETESAISRTFENLRGETTVISIAHRLATVRKADLVVYMDNGAIICSGTFDEVKQKVPNFDRQARLLGL